MADPAKYRTKEEVQEWQERDPIKTLGENLVELGKEDLRNKIDEEIENEIMEAVKYAEESPFPAPNTATDFAYIDA